MPTLKHPCPDCGTPIEVFFRSYCFDCDLKWSESYRCEQCGLAIEADGGESIPEPYRDMDLKERGSWAVVLREGAPIIKAMKGIRKVLELSMSELHSVRASLPGPIFEGTLDEAKCMSNKLTAEDAPAFVVRSGTPLDRLDPTELVPTDEDVRQEATIHDVDALAVRSSTPQFLEWVQAFLGKYVEGDKVFKFCTSLGSWEQLAGKAGFELVRDGEVVERLIVRMN